MASPNDNTAVPTSLSGGSRWETPEEAPLSDAERKTGRWIAIGLTAALTGSIGGVLVELVFS